MCYYYLYKITNLLNNKVYIGQSIKETERWRQHKYFGRNPEKTGQYIHRAMAKYGIENFTYEVIAMCKTFEDADETETILINQYNSREKEYGYNLAPGGNVMWKSGLPSYMYPMYGKKQSEYFKQRMSEIHKGKKVIHTEETKNKISKTVTGHFVSEETKMKISEKHKGKSFSEETRLKLSNARIGKPMSEETKKKLSLSHKSEKSSKAKLTWEDVEQIRRKFSEENCSTKSLMEEYNVCKDTIYKIIHKKIWKDRS